MGLFGKNAPATQSATTSAPGDSSQSGLLNGGNHNPKAEALAIKFAHQREMAQLRAQEDHERLERQAQRRQETLKAVQQAGSGLLNRWKAYRAEKRKRRFASDEFVVELDHFDGIERAKLLFARAALFLGAFVLMVVASWSVGFFFADLQDFTWGDQHILFSYLGSFALEGIFTGLMFAASLNKKRGRSWLLMLSGAIVLAFVSMFAQYSSYETQYVLGKLQTSDSAIESIPLLTWLIGSMKGHSFLFLLRGGAFHVAEIFACLCMPSGQKSVDEQIDEMKRVQNARRDFEEAQLFMEWRAEAGRRANQEFLRGVHAASPALPAPQTENEHLPNQGTIESTPAASKNRWVRSVRSESIPLPGVRETNPCWAESRQSRGCERDI